MLKIKRFTLICVVLCLTLIVISCGEKRGREINQQLIGNVDSFKFRAVNAGLKPVANGSVAVGHLNGDNHMDIALAGSTVGGAEIVKLYYNDGKANFDTAEQSFSAAPSRIVRLGDLDGDNLNDLVLAGNQTSAIYWNNGKDSFSQAGVNLPGIGNGDLKLGDLNGDNRLDIAMVGNGQGLVYLNDGDGEFSRSNAGIGGVSNGTLALGDLDGDNAMDMVVAGVNTNNEKATKVYLNGGKGQFSAKQTDLDGIANGGVALGDLNGDSHLDIGLAGSEITKVFYNDGDLNFNGSNGAVKKFEKVTNASTEITDLNEDGKPEFLITGVNESGREATLLYLNEGGKKFNITYSGLTRIQNAGIGLGDVNNDDHLDVVLAGSGVTDVQINRSFEDD